MRVLMIGAYGQVGQELFRVLSGRIGVQNIVCSDIRIPPEHLGVRYHYTFDVLDRQMLYKTVQEHKITHLYCLTALLSVTGQDNPLFTEKLNMHALFNCLQVCKDLKVKRMFWPSSIAAFGTNTPRDFTPQETIMEPGTVYGITKKAGQLWCAYYNKKYGVDVRSIRYPGLVGYRSLPGGGTTDYAVDIFHKAKLGQRYSCYLKQDTYLPMMYTDDAIQGTLQLMDAPSQNITIRTSYNLQAMSFCPKQIAEQIKKHIPGFQITYQINELKQSYADSWPKKLDDAPARRDWLWKPRFELPQLVKQILDNLEPKS